MSATIFYKRLDTFRFIAVSLVLISHYIGFVKNYVNTGEIGVLMFFVLSGFLITNSLLAALNAGFSKANIMASFYVRRFLRIFPIYYFVIFIFAFFFKDDVLLKDINYYLFYGVNFLVIAHQQWPSHFSHFWSLSIEEQFYLFWPLVLIPFFSKKRTFFKLVSILCILIIYLFISYKSFNNEFFLMNSFFSSLAIVTGSLLSWGMFYRKEFIFYRHLNKLFPVAFSLICLLFFFKNSTYFRAFFLILTILISLLMIVYLIADDANFKNTDVFWMNKLIRYFGKISYGIYVYHNFMPFLFSKIGFNRETSMSGSTRGYIIYYLIYPLSYFFFTIIISMISWEVIEKPINTIKKYFPYNRGA